MKYQTQVGFKSLKLIAVLSCMALGTSAVADDIIGSVDGGISGGGGGLVNPNPYDIDEFSRGMDLMMPAVRFTIHSIGDHLVISNSPLYSKIFTGPNSIYEVLKNGSASNSIRNPQGGNFKAFPAIELRMSEPCLDSQGLPRDASIYASRPGYICMSAFQIAPKVNAMTFEAQVGALYIHELSHLAGANESEAVEIQQIAIQILSRTNFREQYLRSVPQFSPMRKVWSSLVDSTNDLSSDTLDTQLLKQKLLVTKNALYDFRLAYFPGSGAPFGFSRLHMLEIAMFSTRIRAALQFLDDPTAYQKRWISPDGLYTADSLSFMSFWLLEGGQGSFELTRTNDDLIKQSQIQRIKSNQDLTIQVEQLKAHLDRLKGAFEESVSNESVRISLSW